MSRLHWPRVSGLIFITAVLPLFQNCTPMHSLGEAQLNSASAISEAELAEKFSTTLQPALRRNCAACHGLSQVPQFAVDDPLAAVRTIFRYRLVDLDVPRNSYFIAKILSGHNSFPTSYADEVEAGVEAWAAALNTAPAPLPTPVPVPIPSPSPLPAPSPAPIPSPSPDIQPPSVTLTAPTAGTVSGSVSVSAVASDNVGVAGVQFFVNDVAQGAEDLSSPYAVTWNTTSLANGNYTLTARARDAAGNLRVTTGVTVKVENVNPNAKFSWISANILGPKCVACHGATTAYANVRFNTYANTRLEVIPLNPGGSRLYTVTQPGSIMPPSGDKLNSAELKAIYDWIQLGAPNN